MSGPSVLAVVLTTKYFAELPLYLFETVLSRHGTYIPRHTLAAGLSGAASITEFHGKRSINPTFKSP